MGSYSIQFQKGMSLIEFHSKYGAESQCLEALIGYKWLGGFRCRECGGHEHCRIKSRNLFQCNRCHKQESIKANTIFHNSNLPLTKWFLGMFLLTQSKNGISSVELGRHLGVTQPTAWMMKHKLMQVMFERDRSKQLDTKVQVDDAYLGGRKKGKRGRGAEGKTPFIAAVEIKEIDSDNNDDEHETEDGKKKKKELPMRVKLTVLKSFRSHDIEKWSKAHLGNDCEIISDGCRGFSGFGKAGFNHNVVVIGNAKSSPNSEYIKWVNVLLGNLKTALKGTYKAQKAKYRQRYLSEFEYRYNRRNDLRTIFPRLLSVSARTPPIPRHLLTMAVNGA